MPTFSFWQRLGAAEDLACDVAVVGGGIAGVSTAYWLRRLRPNARVALVEGHRLAHGASGRNAGFLLQGAGSDYALDVARHGRETARRLWALTRENRDSLLAELDPAAFTFEPAGSLVAAGTPEEGARLRTAVPMMRADGYPAAYLTPADLHRRIKGQGFFGGLYVTTGGTLDPAALVRHIAARSEATVLEHHLVSDVHHWGKRLVLETRERRVVADRVVFALNAYAPLLLPSLAAYVRPVRAQMLATERMLPRWLSQPVYSHDGFFYIRQHPSGHVLVGGARHLHEAHEVGHDDATTGALQADLEAYLQQHFPHTQGVKVERRWSGVMGFSPDGLPVVGTVPGSDGALFACGFTGHGMAYGFRVGRMLAELALGLPAADADLFAPERLTTGGQAGKGDDWKL
ncbi:MAG TPA: FAD-binding oxidoreductase [Rhodothermales bacterium]|nr:FAD-binding oxidoreductase [Rhodothermales bacterium]